MTGWTAITADAEWTEEMEAEIERANAHTGEIKSGTIDGNQYWVVMHGSSAPIDAVREALHGQFTRERSVFEANWVTVVTNNDTEPQGHFSLYLPKRLNPGLERVDQYEELASERLFDSVRNSQRTRTTTSGKTVSVESTTDEEDEWRITPVAMYAKKVYDIDIVTTPFEI